MNPWLQIFAAENACGRIVCFPRAGGTTTDFAEWAGAFGDIEVSAVQLPGRLRRYGEPAMRAVEPIVQEVVQALQELEYLPLVLFGDCMGAIFAFEIVRQLRRASLPLPTSLIVASYAAPDQKRNSPNFHDAPTKVFRDHLLEVGGLPPEVIAEDELFTLLLPSLRADFELFEKYEYVPEPPLEVHICAIGGQADPHVSLLELEGWRRHTCQRFTMRRFAGGHFFLRDNPSVLDFIKEVAAFVPLDELPPTPNGKLNQQAPEESDSAKTELTSTFIAPRDELESTLTQIWEDVLGIRPVGVRDNFWDLGGHSLLAIGLLGQIRKTFNRDLPLSVLFQEPTIEHLASILCRKEEVSPLSSFVPLQTYGSRPLFFIGGSNPRYKSLARHLGLEQPSYRLDVYALQEQCLASGREPYIQIADMATHFVEKIRAVQSVGPYFLGGGCEAGYVVYEIARQLQREGEQIGLLILWEVPPSPFSREKRKKPFYAVFYIAHHLRSLFTQGLKKKITRLVEKVRAAHSSPPLSSDASRLQWIETSISKALRNYVPQVYQGRITLFRAHEQQPGIYDPTVGWDELVTGGTEIYVVPGNHTTCFEKHFLNFAEQLKTCLEKAQMLASDIDATTSGINGDRRL